MSKELENLQIALSQLDAKREMLIDEIKTMRWGINLQALKEKYENRFFKHEMEIFGEEDRWPVFLNVKRVDMEGMFGNKFEHCPTIEEFSFYIDSEIMEEYLTKEISKEEYLSALSGFTGQLEQLSKSV